MNNISVASAFNRAPLVKPPLVEYDFPLSDCYMGVEIEVDSDNSYRPVHPPNYSPEWNRVYDGSLVAGKEYVLARPMCGAELASAIRKFYSGGTSVKRTYTGSTHIHMNMSDGVTVEVLQAMSLLAYVFEGLLYYVGDNTRQWCGFANRLTSAPHELLEVLLAEEFNPRALNRVTSDYGKYYGFNTQSLGRYCTVEFRYFPTAETEEELLDWISLVQMFKKAAMDLGTTDAVINTLVTQDGYNSFVDTYFPKYKEEVNKVCDYDHVRCLMQKAIIISSAAYYPNAGKYSTERLVDLKLVAKADTPEDAPVDVPPYYIHDISRMGSHPPSETLRVRAVEATGKDEVIALLPYSGSLYWASPTGYRLLVEDILYGDNFPYSAQQISALLTAALETDPLSLDSRQVVRIAHELLAAGVLPKALRSRNSFRYVEPTPYTGEQYEEEEEEDYPDIDDDYEQEEF